MNKLLSSSKFFRAIRMIALVAVSSMSISAALAQQDYISTIAGAGPSGMPAVNANLNYVGQIAFDAQGNYYFAGYRQNRIFKVTPSGVLTLVAGNGVAGYGGDGALATNAELNSPTGITVDGADPADVYIADTNNCLVRKVAASTGIITTIAGLVTHPATGNPYSTCGYSGDGAAADAAELSSPNGLAFNPKTNTLYIADAYNGRIRAVAGASPTSTITTVAGGGGTTNATNNCQGTAPYGDGSSAVDAYLCDPQGVAVDTSVSPANLFISEGGGSNRCTVREVVGSSGKITLIAGQYNSCGFLDNPVATSGQLNYPYQITASVSGASTTISLADAYNQRIRQFTLTYSGGVPKPGTLKTIAGTGSASFCGDGGLATNACLDYPIGVATDSAGDVYIGDNVNDRVRKITHSTGDISTVAGWGNVYYNDPANLGTVPVTGLTVYNPTAVFADRSSSDIYIGNTWGHSEYVFNSSTGSAATLAGNGVAGFAGDGSAGNSAGTELNYPENVAKDSSGNVYISDTSNCAIREISASSGDLTTVIGGSKDHLNGCGFSGDGGPAQDAQLNQQRTVAVDSSNNLYIADYNNCRVRKVVLSTGTITTIAGTGACNYNGDGLAATAADLNGPEDVAVDGAGNVYIADAGNQRIREVNVASGLISTVAGDGVANYTGDGLATGRSLNGANGIAADPNGNLFVTDSANNLLRWVDPGGTMVTIAGSYPGSTEGSNGFSGDGGPAVGAMMANPQRSTQDGSGNYYVADFNNQRIRKISAFAGYGRSTANLQFTEEQPVGTTSGFEPVTLSAIGPVTFNSIGVPAGFSEIDDCAGSALTAGQTCEVDVYFSPTQVGTTKGTLTISSNALFNTQGSTVALSGHAVGLTSSGPVNFAATQLVGVATTQTVTLTNTGAMVKLGSISIPNSASFSVSGGSCSNGTTLATKGTCTITVQFKPASAGVKNAVLTVNSSDPGSPLLLRVTGVGTQLTPSPTSLSFGTVAKGSTKVLDLKVTNSNGSFTLSPAISGSGFTIVSSGNTCTAAIPAGGSCNLPVQFAPTSQASYGGALTLVSSAGSASPTVALTGGGGASASRR